MNDLSDELQRLRKEDQNIAQILDGFKVLDDIYQESLKAMGHITEALPAVRSSANVTLSLDNLTPSTSDATLVQAE